MKLTAHQIDALTELMNIGAGKAAGILNEMLNAHIVLQVPMVSVFYQKELEHHAAKLWEEELSIVRMRFQGPFTGLASIIFPHESAARLVDLIMDTADDSLNDLDSVKTGTLSEVGNIILNGVMGTIANILGRHLQFSIPSYLDGTILKFLSSQSADANTIVLLAHTRLTVKEHMIEGDIVLLFELLSFGSLMNSIENYFTC